MQLHIYRRKRAPFLPGLAASGGASRHTIVFYAFDLLHLDGENLTGRPLKERRLLVPKVVKDSGVHILAPQGGELGAQAALIVGHRMKRQDVVESIPMFPTFSEAIKLVALSFTRDVSKMSCCV